MRKIAPALQLDSAGTSGWHIGDPPYGPMQKAARRRGIDLSDLSARLFVGADFERFDLIVAMDRDNQRDIEALRPQGNETPVVLFAPYGDPGLSDVPDPYYTRDFDGVLDLIEQAAAALLAQLEGSGRA